MRSFFIFIMVVFTLALCNGQSIQNVRATFDDVNGSVDVFYDLSAQGNRRYKVEVFCSVDSGRTFSSSLVGVSGDVGYNIKPGFNKHINWAYFVDMPGFTGENTVIKVIAKVDVEYKENIILSLGGPEKFYQSVILPGYGNYHVRNGKGYMAIAGAVYGLIGAGVYFNYKAKAYYSDYKSSTSVESANRNFDKAQQLHNISNGLLLSGATIWAIDVGQVIAKGIRNRRLQKDILRRRQK